MPYYGTSPLRFARLRADERFEDLTDLGDDAGGVAVRGQVDDDAVDSFVEYPTLDLLGHLLGRTGERPSTACLFDVARRAETIDHQTQQRAGLQSSGVAADFVATLPQHVQFGGQVVDVGEQVEMVGVARGQPEGLLLTAAAKHDRDVVPVARLVDGVLGAIPLAGEAGSLAVEHRDDDLQSLFELFEPLGERVEVEAQLPVFELE